ncbi:MAG: hypothetical protein J6R79_01715 [Bacteroidaceae bacterium]|nr:hypothetical protein [Bacteroidaceae bacterium]
MEILKALYNVNSKSGREEEIKAFFLLQVADLHLHIEEDEIGNLFITKGEAQKYPCLTAHLDEVHEQSPYRIVEEASGIFGEDEQGKMMGIGADDKNGLWIIIKLLHELPVLKVALFVEEEKKGDLAGCRGSRACSLHHFDNVLYVLAVDRKGCSEVVINGKGDVKLCDASFPPTHLLQKYKYECVDGGKTDVVELKMRGLEVPCCNISCGYYNAHKSEEYTNVLHLKNALAFVRAWVEYTLATENIF